jgi:uncharacterized protein YggE
MVLLSAIQVGSQPPAPPRISCIMVSGHGRVVVRSNQACIRLQVEETDLDIGKAKIQVDVEIKLLKTRLGTIGIPDSDYTISPLTVQKEPHSNGFAVSRDISVLVRSIDLIETVIDEALKSGINNVPGVVMQHSNIDSLRSCAVDRAIEDAQKKARELADRSGVRVGRIYSIQNDEFMKPRPSCAQSCSSAEGVASCYAERKKITVDASVDVVFTIRQR